MDDGRRSNPFGQVFDSPVAAISASLFIGTFLLVKEAFPQDPQRPQIRKVNTFTTRPFFISRLA
jgi:hypothetical protein